MKRTRKPNPAIGSAGFEVNHGPNDLISDIEQDQCHFLDKSTERFGGDAVTNKRDQEFSCYSFLSPMIHIHDNSLLNVSNSLVASNEVHAKSLKIIRMTVGAGCCSHTGMPAQN